MDTDTGPLLAEVSNWALPCDLEGHRPADPSAGTGTQLLPTAPWPQLYSLKQLKSGLPVASVSESARTTPAPRGALRGGPRGRRRIMGWGVRRGPLRPPHPAGRAPAAVTNLEVGSLSVCLSHELVHLYLLL